MVFKILKLNLLESRSVGYYPGSLKAIKAFEICADIKTGRIVQSKGFEKKFAQAVQLLRQNNLIMQDHAQSHAQEFVELTERGEAREPEDNFLSGERISKIVENLKNSIKNFDPIVECYLNEGLKTYENGFLISSAFCLGAMSERCILLLAKKVEKTVQNSQASSEYGNLRNIKGYWNFTKKYLEDFKKIYPGNKELWYELDVKIDFMFTNYRLTRNEVGHPDFIPNIDPNEHELRIKVTPKYIETIFKVLGLP